jgi:exosome complex component CSL4
MQEKAIPGDFLAVGEAYNPGYNTYEENGKVYSKILGFRDLNKDFRRANIKGRAKRILAVGDIVYAIVTGVRKNLVQFEILQAQEENIAINDAFATLLVSDVSFDYVDSLEELFKIGDIVKAKLKTKTNYALNLTTKERDLGVVRAFCVRCRHSLERFGNLLKCPNCQNRERRKLSNEYL